jgi:rhodanese-related sulfurtransferase
MKHSEEFLRLVEDAKSRVKEISPEQVRSRQGKGVQLVLVDTREDREWDAGHIAGARHIGRGVIERDILKEIPGKSTEIILYCGGGYRSALAADNLQKMGYTNVLSMSGGWREWNERGYPTE